MSTIPGLPLSLETRLTFLDRRLRSRSLFRGACWLFLALSLGAGLAMAADAWVELPRFTRGFLLGIWAAGGIGLIGVGLLPHILRRKDATALAALVESRYPELHERLTTTVELSGPSDLYHGSDRFIQLLARETEKQIKPLDLLQAAPVKRTGALALSALGALLILMVALALWPSRSAELAGRFFLPWRIPTLAPAFAVSITPGDAFVGKGQSLTITASFEMLEEKASRPRSAKLIARGDGEKRILRMEAEQTDQFTIRLPHDLLERDFSYWVQIGNVASPTYKVQIIEPVALLPNSPALEVTPPPYAAAAIPKETKAGLTDITALQYSALDLHCQFSRPAVAAYFEWSPDAGVKRLLPLQLSDDRDSALFHMPLATPGIYRLIMEAEHGIRTESTSHRIEIKIDLPPAFERVSGSNDLKVVRPYDSISLEASLNDDVSVESAYLEYAVGNGPVRIEPMTLEGKGAHQALARHVLSLSGIVQENDEVKYRLKVMDNRRVPEAHLEPQATYYPEKEWRLLKIAKQAQPLFQQEIEAQRDAVNKKIDSLKANLEAEKRAVYKLNQESKEMPSLAAPQASDLKEVTRDNRANEESLRKLAQETSEAPGMERLAEQAQEIADQEMRQSEEALRDAGRRNQAEPRQKDLTHSEAELENALRKLDRLKEDNQKLARERIEQKNIEAAAQRERELAKQAEQLANNPDPVKADPHKAEAIKKQQQELAEDIKKMTENSEPLKKALEAARENRAKELAQQARELAQAERDLDRSIRDREKEQLKGRFDDLAKKQQELADKVDRLAKKSEPLLDKQKEKNAVPKEAKQAAEALKNENPSEALKHQDLSNHELDQLASKLDRASKEARASRESAQELSRRQKELQEKLHNQKDSKDPRAMPALEQEQRVLEQAIKDLPTPLDNKNAQEAQKQAQEKAESAANQFKGQNPEKVSEEMQKAHASLEKLTQSLPDKSQANKANEQAKKQPGFLEKEQGNQARQLAKEQKDLRDAVAKTTSEAIKGDESAKKNPLGELAKDQREVAQKAQKLAEDVRKEQGDKGDAPAQAQKASRSAQKATEQMQAGSPEQAIEAGQKSAEDLKQLARQLQDTPANPDPQAPDTAQEARQLAKQQEEINKKLEPLKDDTKARQAQQKTRQSDLKDQTGQLQKQLQDLANDLGNSPPAQQKAREAAGLTQESQNSMELSKNQGQQGQTGPASQSRQQAAKSLDKAAQQAAKSAQQMAIAQKAQPGQNGNAQAGQSLQRAKDQMGRAQTELGKGQNDQAKVAMNEAADNLEKASQELAKNQAGQKGVPKGGANPAKGADNEPGKVDASVLPADMKQYAGKRWGELPGELQTQIIQDMKAKYGDSHARMIKLYFEQVGQVKK